eukprot:5143697-Amphidinium_carterae.4
MLSEREEQAGQGDSFRFLLWFKWFWALSCLPRFFAVFVDALVDVAQQLDGSAAAVWFEVECGKVVSESGVKKCRQKCILLIFLPAWLLWDMSLFR